MKKVVLFFILLLIPFNTKALTKEVVTLKKCIDGDTASFILNKESIKARFLAIDTPESVHPTKSEEPFGKEASEYTCTKLKNAKKIEIENDSNSDKTDKYGRYLVWVYVDDELLQKDLVSKGYAKVAYLYGDYLYTDLLKKEEDNAKNSKLKIWNDYTEPTNKKDNDNIVEWLINLLNEILKKILDLLENFVDDML